MSVHTFEERILNHRYCIRSATSAPSVIPLFPQEFTSTAALPSSVSASSFVEYGCYRGHYYGTSVESVHRVMADGKLCLLDVHPSVSRIPPKKTKKTAK